MIPGSPFVTGKAPSCVAADPKLPYIFVANYGDNTMSDFKIGAGGVLTVIPGTPFPTDQGPVFVAFNPRGDYLFLATQGSATIYAFNVCPDGLLGSYNSVIFDGFLGGMIVLPPDAERLFLSQRYGHCRGLPLQL